MDTRWVFYAGCQIISLFIGVILDFLLGDPVYWFHPIRLIGSFITKIEKILRNLCCSKKKENQKAEYRAGICLTGIVALTSTIIPMMLLGTAYNSSVWLGILLESIFCYQLLAIKSLKTESEKVYQALQTKTLEDGRKAVSMIVGRDTDKLDETGVIKATVETIAENTSDGAIAPLFYMVIGGASLGFFYKAVNTLDSMVGYKNETYLYFGRASAKFDDILNYIPSRLAALFMIGVSPFLGYSIKNAFWIWKRDSRNHASPNSAQTEAACAGALKIQLAGDAWYFGNLYKKPRIGEKLREVEREDIKRANRLLYGTAILALFIFLAIKTAILGLWI